MVVVYWPASVMFSILSAAYFFFFNRRMVLKM